MFFISAVSKIFIKKINIAADSDIFSAYRMDKAHLTAMQTLTRKMLPAAAVHIISGKGMTDT